MGRSAAVLQYTQFAYTTEATRRRMNNTATPKARRFDEEWGKLDLAPMVMTGKADLPEASLILTSVKPELTAGGTQQTRIMPAPFGCEEGKVVHGEEEDHRNFLMGQGLKSKGPQVQERIQDETMVREEAVDRKNLCNRIPIKPRNRTIRLRQEECPAWIQFPQTLKTARTHWKR